MQREQLVKTNCNQFQLTVSVAIFTTTHKVVVQDHISFPSKREVLALDRKKAKGDEETRKWYMHSSSPSTNKYIPTAHYKAI